MPLCAHYVTLFAAITVSAPTKIPSEKTNRSDGPGHIPLASIAMCVKHSILPLLLFVPIQNVFLYFAEDKSKSQKLIRVIDKLSLLSVA